MIGGNGNDLLTGGTGPNIFIGGKGNDTLIGGTGSNRFYGGVGDDTYVFNLGDGAGTITDTALVGEGNRILFGAGITREMLSLSQNQNTLTVTVGSGGDAIHLTNFNSDNVSGSLVVETLAFADNSEVSLVSLLLPPITITGTDDPDVIIGTAGNDGIDAKDGNDLVYGNSGHDFLLGGGGNDALYGEAGNDWVRGGQGNDILTGDAGDDWLEGEDGADSLDGGEGTDMLNGGAGDDTVLGGAGDDAYEFNRNDGQDIFQETSGTADSVVFNADINPLDLVISRQADDLRLSLHGTSDQMTIQNWYTSGTNQIETLQAGNGQALVNSQVDQLLQAMATFTQQNGLTWDQAIDQRPQDVQNILAANWQ